MEMDPTLLDKRIEDLFVAFRMVFAVAKDTKAAASFGGDKVTIDSLLRLFAHRDRGQTSFDVGERPEPLPLVQNRAIPDTAKVGHD